MKIARALSILIASDNTVLSECLAERLAREPGFRPATATARAEEIPAALRREPFDVLLLDADGVGPIPEDLLVLLRQRQPELKILVLAARADDPAVARVLRQGANGVVGRGEGLADLFRAIVTVAGGQTWARRRAIAHALEGLPKVRPARGAALTPRERQILELLGDGYRNKELASLLHIKEQTVKIHLHSLFRKLNVRSRVEAALKAAALS